MKSRKADFLMNVIIGFYRHFDTTCSCVDSFLTTYCIEWLLIVIMQFIPLRDFIFTAIYSVYE